MFKDGDEVTFNTTPKLTVDAAGATDWSTKGHAAGSTEGPDTGLPKPSDGSTKGPANRSTKGPDTGYGGGGLSATD